LNGGGETRVRGGKVMAVGPTGTSAATPPCQTGETVLPGKPGAATAAGAGAAALAAAMAATMDLSAKEARAEQQELPLIILNVEFRSTDRARVMNLRTEVHTIKMGTRESAVEYFNRGWALVWELNMLGVIIVDENLLSALLTGLDDKFAQQKKILANMDELDMEKAVVKLRAGETRMRPEKQRRAPPLETALASSAGVEKDS